VITWHRQADAGFARICIEESWKVRGSLVFFLGSFDDPTKIFDNVAVMTKITRFGPSMLKVVARPAPPCSASSWRSAAVPEIDPGSERCAPRTTR
jgi:hypothetical protein